MISPAGLRLAESHRLAQRRIGARTVVQMRAAWPTLDPDNLDDTFQTWLQLVEPIVSRDRDASSQLAARFVSAYRSIELGVDAAFTPTIAAPLAPARLRTSMLVTGPVSIKSKIARQIPLVQALTEAEASSSGAAMRHAVDGGRQTVLETIRNDPATTGWQRITSGNACEFCTMLASRVYRLEESASFQSHDSCLCSAAPVYG